MSTPSAFRNTERHGAGSDADSRRRQDMHSYASPSTMPSHAVRSWLSPATDRPILQAPPITSGYAFGGLVIMAVLAAAVVGNWFAPQPCESEPVRLAVGSVATAAMTLATGRSCVMTVNVGSTPIRDITIMQPRNGTVVPRGRTGVVYIPHARFKGEDLFSFSLVSGAARAESIVLVKATVK